MDRALLPTGAHCASNMPSLVTAVADDRARLDMSACKEARIAPAVLTGRLRSASANGTGSRPVNVATMCAGWEAGRSSPGSRPAACQVVE